MKTYNELNDQKEIDSVIMNNRLSISNSNERKKVFDNYTNLTASLESKNISVVVQGAINRKLTPRCLKSIRKYLPEAEIILSTWQGSNTDGLEYDKLILNEDPGAVKVDLVNNVTNNQNRQLVSTQNGIKQASRAYILKLRTDLELKSDKFLQYFEKFDNRDNKYNIFRHRIIVSSVFSREYSCCTQRPILFHPSDIFLFGLREDLMDYFASVRLATSEELGCWHFLYPDRLPYLEAKYRYAPEQFFLYSYLIQFFPEIQFDDWTDWNEANLKISKCLLYNNFIFLDYKQSGIYSKKFIKIMRKPESIYGLISFKKFQEVYKKKFDTGYKPRLTLQKKCQVKLKKHFEKFVIPLLQFTSWIGELLSVIFYSFAVVFTSLKLGKRND